MKRIICLLAVVLMTAGWTSARAESQHRLGVGANYWVALDDIDTDNIDDSGFSYLVTYQYVPGLVGIELDGELLPDRYGEDAYAPQAYVLLGKAIYAAAGVGIIHQDGDFADDPFYSFKAGLNLEVLPGLFLDVSANYRFESKLQLEDEHTDIDTDTVFVGAAVRIGL